MKKPNRKFKLQFVEKMPSSIEEGVLYVSMRYKVIKHRCACGCGHEVVLPLNPDSSIGWHLMYDGKKLTLRPSVGNFQLPCQSHYWITDNEAVFVTDEYKNEAEIEIKKEWNCVISRLFGKLLNLLSHSRVWIYWYGKF